MTGGLLDAGLTAAIERMAVREADALLRHPLRAAYLDHPPTTVAVVPQPCPWCGCTAPASPPYGMLSPLREIRLVDDPAAGDAPVRLDALACESLTARALVPLARGTGLPSRHFVTRAVAAAPIAHLPAAEVVRRLDAGERWHEAPFVVPASGRLAPQPGTRVPGEIRGALRSHFITPHLAGEPYRRLNDDYLWRREAHVAAALQKC